MLVVLTDFERDINVIFLQFFVPLENVTVVSISDNCDIGTKFQ